MVVSNSMATSPPMTPMVMVVAEDLPITLVTVETTDFDVMSAWIVEDIVDEAVIVVDMSVEGQEFLLSSVMIIINMVNNGHFGL